MNAKVRQVIDLSDIYIKEKVTNRKIPAQVPAESSAIKSTLRRRMWGTWSHKNLMKDSLECRSVKNGP